MKANSVLTDSEIYIIAQALKPLSFLESLNLDFLR